MVPRMYRLCRTGPAWAPVLRTILRRTSSNVGEDARQLVAVPEERFHELVAAEVSFLATVPVQPVSMQQIVTWCDTRDMVPFIQTEIPKRFALRIRLIETLEGWQEIPELAKLHQRLTRWYRELVLLNYSTQDSKHLIKTLKAIRDEGRDVIGVSASGIYKLHKMKQQDTKFLDRWLDGFLLSRIGTNALFDQFVAIASKQDGGLGRPTGITDPRCNASKVCEHAAQMSAYLCYQRFGHEPKYTVEDFKAGEMGPQAKPCLFSYIPSYLRYIMCELLKNSFRATLMTSSSVDDISKRPVRIRVCRDEHRVAILVSDEAGGIPFEVGDRIWSYMYGTAAKQGSSSLNIDDVEDSLSGYGVGLPCARLYARYLGGNLSLTSYPGYGTQAHLLLPRIDSEQVEEVPETSFHDPDRKSVV